MINPINCSLRRYTLPSDTSIDGSDASLLFRDDTASRPPPMPVSPPLRALIRSLPCRPSVMPKLRDAFADLAKASSPSAADSPMVAETLFYLKSQNHLNELNLRYFPQSGMSQRELTESTAKRVGLNMPKTYEDEKA